MKTLKLTHAGLNIPVHIYPAQLFGFYWSKTSNHTILFSNGTTTIPVKESCEQVEMQIQELQGEGQTGQRGVLHDPPTE